MSSLLNKSILIIFAFNVLSLYLYFLPPSSFPSSSIPDDSDDDHNELSSLKAWPSLPSYLPWSSNPSRDPESCESFFGNGFTRRVNFLRRGGGRGWFRCMHNAVLGSSVCEGGRVRMASARIRMARGGERLEEVIGRKEEDELPVFEEGAFEVEGDGGVWFPGRKWGNGWRRWRVVGDEDLERFLPDNGVERHTMRELIGNLTVVGKGELQCDKWIYEPTLLVTRYEYANLFHTVTDWYSSYAASRVAGLPYRPRLIFVDGHCSTPLEEVWKAMFSSVTYAKNFSGAVCFRHAIFVPLGYETAIFKGLSRKIPCRGASIKDQWKNPDDKRTARLSEFGEMIRASFGLPADDYQVDKPFSTHNVLFIRREDYLAHPRHKGKVESRLSNEQHVFDSLKSWATNYQDCSINLIDGRFAHISMKDQVKAIQEASVIISAHGAGLTHIVSAMSDTVILEIVGSKFQRPHFALIARWRGLEYHAMNLNGSFADPDEVVDKLRSIVENMVQTSKFLKGR